MRRAVCCLLIFASLPAAGQWLNPPTPGLPRTADGKLDLTAPVPRTADGKPDLSGFWEIDAGRAYEVNITAELEPEEIQPWARALYRQRIGDFTKDDPGLRCLPEGPRTFFKGGLAKFVQTPHLVVILYQDLNYRQIHLDGRVLPEVLHATWMGNSTGRWEGDTLVVESNGFNAASWLDAGGHPHTEALRITERFTRRDVGHMDVSVTFDDREVYARPWTVSFAVELAPDTELIEAECNEVDPSEYRLSGRTAEQQSLVIPAEVLLRYVGTYDVRSRRNRDVIDYSLRFTIADDELRLDVDGVGNLPLVAVSTTMFSPPSGGVYEFVTDADGVVTHLVAHGVSGDSTGVRRK